MVGDSAVKRSLFFYTFLSICIKQDEIANHSQEIHSTATSKAKSKPTPHESGSSFHRTEGKTYRPLLVNTYI